MYKAHITGGDSSSSDLKTLAKRRIKEKIYILLVMMVVMMMMLIYIKVSIRSVKWERILYNIIITTIITALKRLVCV